MKGFVLGVAMSLAVSQLFAQPAATNNDPHSFANWSPDGRPGVHWIFAGEDPTKTVYYAYVAHGYVAQVWLKMGIRGPKPEDCTRNCLVGDTPSPYTVIKMVAGDLGCDPSGKNPKYVQNVTITDFEVPSGRAINPHGKGGFGVNMLITNDDYFSLVVNPVCSAVRKARGEIDFKN